MCGPADYHALHTCILRIALLSIAGLISYAAQRAIRFCGSLRREKPAQLHARVRPDARAIL
jgi:hypothetical protein